MSRKKSVKVTLTRPDGTQLEIEGEPEDVLKAVLALSPPPSAPIILVQPLAAPYVAPPIVIPSPYWVEPQPFVYGTEITCSDNVAGVNPPTETLTVYGGPQHSHPGMRYKG